MEYFKDIWTTIKTIAHGMKITMDHLLFWENQTISFPEEKRPLPPRFRGVLHNDIELCIGCLLCAKACPVDCIHIKCDGKGKDRWVTQFDIDISKCMWCELCVEACPDNVKSLSMTPEYEISAYNQEDMMLHFGKGPMKGAAGVAAAAAAAAAPKPAAAPAAAAAAPVAAAAPAAAAAAAAAPVPKLGSIKPNIRPAGSPPIPPVIRPGYKPKNRS